MTKIFVFYGNEDFLIDKEILEIEKQRPNGQVIKYELNETNIRTLIEEASMISLFEDEKIIIGYDADFLSGAIKKEKINHDIEALSTYIEHPNPNSTIILIVNSDKLDKRKKIVKKILEKAEVKELNKLSSSGLLNFAKTKFANNNYQITLKALNMLIELVGSNLYLLDSECEKLMIYKIDEKKIEEVDIDDMIVKYDFSNDFALIDAVIDKEINKALTLYHELLKRNEEPIKILVMLANKFRLIFQVKRLHSKGFNNYQIAGELGAHPYSVELANKVKLKDEELLKYLELLANLDESIKTGKINKDVGLEMFLLKL
ncbi:MAG: DNA polymerase III subunit delta [Bacilli bacterium]|nr:DNA polymerase III subunit delta [Bacilli bacterium]MDD3305278.1 DNA polymerase III subunit delta [Bacilli bacterium]MDD4053568.1 DNA polymerase III subunit delta [Bacilli bacterium]MDD4411465.1 DNA polymerase III subunit delta [Bacilli bacterium]